MRTSASVSYRWLVVFGLLIAAMVLMTVYARVSASPEFVSYTPVLWDGRRFVERPELLTSDHQVRMLMLLGDSNGVFIDEHDNLHIRKSLARDQDLLSNYVSKAIDLPEEQVDRARSRVLAKYRRQPGTSPP